MASIQFQRLKYSNGDVYEGFWLMPQQCPHGQGIYTWAAGVKYDGSWQNGQTHGYGTQTYPSGDKYEGGWKEGQWHGYGELYRAAQGRTYQGGFQAGLEHGYAVIK